MQTEYERTTVSLPAHLMDYLKSKNAEAGVPVSRLIAAALREKIARESKSKTKGVKKP